MKSIIKSIRTGKIKNYSFGQQEFQSAYKKNEEHQRAKVTFLGIEGDEQADLKYHGGQDKAIHMGAISHLEKNPNFDKLSIGCNILVDGIDEEDVCIGDIYKIGELLVEVTQPRQPCWKIGALFGKEVSRYISKNHATGWYLRVLKEALISKDEQMILEKRVSSITVKELSQYLKNPPEKREIIDEILNLEVIANSYRRDFLQSLNSNNL